MSIETPIDEGRFERAVLEALFVDAPVGLGIFDRNLRHVRANATLAEMNGLPEAELIGRTPSELHGELGAEAETLYRKVMDSGEPLSGIEISGAIGSRPEDVRHWSLHFFPIRVEGAIAGLCVVVLDITKRRQLEAQLAHRAFHDDLTGLPNRSLVAEELDRLLARRPPSPRLGVLFVDVDNFKAINDEHGHAAGDTVLRAVAERLPHAVRPSDLTGRWGGDEFVLLVEEVDDAHLPTLTTRLHEVVEHEIDLGPSRFRPSISVGGTVSRPGDTAKGVLERADKAMYEHKRSG
ncbi:MAG: GGDEF domain-containing protein [Solirubrobacteraceae bacterium]|nr:GGDEF domain-containing protein [Solirubrobacteraceae bacterium]